jgi:uncharacterized tellurite resistance protein B-like protein
MLQFIKQFFDSYIASPTKEANAEAEESAYRLATAALLIEITRADYEIKEEERVAVTDAVQRAFNLSPTETVELVQLAEIKSKNATCLYEFTSLINSQFSMSQKERVVELLWEVAFADDHLHRYEEHLVRKIADLIHVPHLKFIKAKYVVRERRGLV